MKRGDGASRLSASLLQEAGCRLHHPRAKVLSRCAHLASGQHKAKWPISQLLLAALRPLRAGREKQQQQQQQYLPPPPGARFLVICLF